MSTDGQQRINTFSDEKIREIGREMEQKIEGEVRLADGDRALYSTDSSNYRQIPLGVILPKSKNDIIETVRICRKHFAPVTFRGDGTSLAGQATNTSFIIDISKYYNKVLRVDQENKTATVQTGIALDTLQHALKKYKLIFGPDPSTHISCTIGGMIGNNACGVHSVLAAFKGGGPRTSDNVVSMEILTIEGDVFTVGKTSEEELSEIIAKGGSRGHIYNQLRDLRDQYGDLIRKRYPDIPRRVSGYNLDDLLPERGFHVARALCGTEGTCAVVLEATLQLIEKSPEISLLVAGFEDVYTAGDFVPEIMKYKPEGLEGMDDILIDLMKRKGLETGFLDKLPRGGGWLLAEFGGKTIEEARRKCEIVSEDLKAQYETMDVRIYDEVEEQEKIWQMRESGLGVTAHVPHEKDAWEGWEDSAAPPEKIGDYMRDFRQLLNRYKYKCTFYGHFGQGIVHTRIDFGLKDHAGIMKFRDFLHEAAKLIVAYGGSLSGEHGDGQSRGELLHLMFGKELVGAFGQFKKIWDPHNLMNPHKVVDPYRVDENLRYGVNYNPPQYNTQFAYPDDKGSFAYAIERCVGVGKCRKQEGGVMCPSYMVTKEEKHSTRGRARLLFEMLQGETIGKANPKNRWRNEDVKDALQLCLACKACKTECPVSVDMASYKAEFRHQYYKGRIKPMTAYTIGLIDVWADIASGIPQIANFITHVPPFSNIIKGFAGISQERRMPRFASQTFRNWYFSQKPRNTERKDRKRVILWTDTFNNYFHPETAKAAVEVLEAAGFEVIVPRQKLCCGRPLYDFGMLDRAKSYLRKVLQALEEEIRSGTAIVGLEPSCISVFREELLNFFPRQENARRLAQRAMMLGEFLQREAPDFDIPKLNRKAKVQMHCHHQSVLGVSGDEELLKKAGLDFEILDSGCCGMAGSFGFEKENYDVSIACAERVLIPEVKSAAKDTLIIANGFSCREQIADLSRKKPMHLAQVLRLALKMGVRQPEKINVNPDR